MTTELLIQDSQKLQYLIGWQRGVSVTPPEQTAEEMASLAMETNGLPDFYLFEEVGGQLISPKTGKPVRESVRQITNVDIREVRFLQALEEWAAKNDEGVALWISPPHPERSPKTKITIIEIKKEEGKKVVINRAIRLNIPYSNSIVIGNRLILDSINPLLQVENPEELRKRIVILAKPEVWIETLEKVLGHLEIFKQIRNDIDVRQKEAAIIQGRRYVNMLAYGFPPSYILEQMDRDMYLGREVGSCAAIGVQTVSSLMDSHSLIYNEMQGKFVRNCGNCGTPINTVISRGYRCSKCGGIYEGC